MAQKTYIVESPIRRDGKRYEVGDKIKLEPAEAEQHLASGTLADPVPNKPAAKGKGDD